MNHITKEKSVDIAREHLWRYKPSGHPKQSDAYLFNDECMQALCNAAIEWHIAQQAALQHEPENEPAVSLASQVEPVGWMYVEATYPEGDLRGRQWKFHQFSRSKPNRPWMQRDVVALYDHPAQAAPKEPNAKLVEALEIGLECAQEIAFITHETLRGYKPKRHAAVDADVAKIEAALDLYKKDQKRTHRKNV